MSHFLQKSDDNLQAAQKLIHEHFLHAPSVHCSYYSCLQLMTHILYNVLNVPPNDIRQDSKSARTGSHEIIINRLVRDLHIISPQASVSFNRQIGLLKNKRVTSDYEDRIIEPTFSQGALKEANEIIRLLKQSYDLN